MHVLLITREKDLHDSLNRFLCTAGHSLARAGDTSEAFSENGPSRRKIDLILVDHTSPAIDLAGWLRDLRHGFGHATCIVLSGYDPCTVRRGFGNGAAPWLIQKPFRPEQLLELMDELMEKT